MSAPTTPTTTAATAAEPPAIEGIAAPVWAAADRLVAHVLADGGGVEALQRHKLGPFAAGWYERAGIEVPQALHEEQRSASLAMMISLPLVRRLRSTVEGPLLLLERPRGRLALPPGRPPLLRR